jgi:hypothetical protein
MRNGGPDARAVLDTSARWGARMRCATADDEAAAVMAAFVDARRGPGTWAALSPRAQPAVLASRSAFVRGFEALLAFTPAPAAVAALGMPVMLLASELSPPDFRVALEFVGQLLPNAERGTISGVGHFGLIEQPEAFNAPLLQWLARANAATSDPDCQRASDTPCLIRRTAPVGLAASARAGRVPEIGVADLGWQLGEEARVDELFGLVVGELGDRGR